MSRDMKRWLQNLRQIDIKENRRMEQQIKVAVYEMLCNLQGQGFIGNNRDVDDETEARKAISQEVEAQLSRYALSGLFECP